MGTLADRVPRSRRCSGRSGRSSRRYAAALRPAEETARRVQALLGEGGSGRDWALTGARLGALP